MSLQDLKEGERVRFFTAASLANLLLEKNSKGTLNTFINTLNKAELIVIDEVGFVPLHKEALKTSGIDEQTLTKILENPDMVKLLKTLAATL